MLTPGDEEFICGFRDRKNMLGGAVQLCALPWLGFVPDDVPAAAVARLSEGLGIPVGELRGYGAREQTRTATCARWPRTWAGARSTGRSGRTGDCAGQER